MLWYRRLFLSLIFGLTGLLWSGDLYAQNADFTVGSIDGCAPYTASFSDQSNPTPTSWAWDFGNGSTSSSQNPSVLYNQPGTYTVSLRVTFPNAGGTITLTKQDYITVYAKPTAAFNFTPSNACSPVPVTFTNNSVKGSAPINNYLWDFGNGVTSTAENPSFTYSQANTYSLSLLVEDTNGCSHSINKPSALTVRARPQAAFGSSTNNGCSAPHIASMVNTSIPNASGSLSYFWDLGNGQQTTGQSPASQYVNPGTYDVMLVVTNSLGCSDTALKDDFVNVQELNAGFSGTNLSGCPPFTSNFTNSSTPVLSGNTYIWYFGDGDTAVGLNTSHVYENNGDFDVRLVMIAPNGCRDTLDRPDYVNGLYKPSASFRANDSLSCRAPFQVQFTNSSSNITSYLWNFGDGNSSTNASPTHTYTDTGFYQVSLIVEGNNGCPDTAIKAGYIRIRPPQADFEPDVLEGCQPLTVNFSNRTKTVAPLASVKYYFGDGDSASTGFPTHEYQDTGIFLPRIRIETDDGCIDEAIFDTIGVGIPPQADFIANDTVGCRDQWEVELINLTNTHLPIAQRFRWESDGGPSKEAENPKYKFNSESGKYDMTLIAYHYGCPDTLTKDTLIEVLNPTSKMQLTTSGCNGDYVYFENKSIGEQMWHRWYFDDGDSSEAQDTGHTYLPGNYRPTLVVYDTSTGCYDTSERFIYVSNSNALQFRADTVGCTRQGIWFLDQTAGTSDWKWTFSNGKEFLSRNAFVTFTEPGYYDVTFSAIVQGCRVTVFKPNYLHVYGPAIHIQTEPGPYCAPYDADLIALTDGEKAITWTRARIFSQSGLHWMQENQADTIQYLFDQPEFPQDSAYYVYYEARDTMGCYNFKYDTIGVYKPEVECTIVQDASCLGTPYFFEGELLDSTSPQPMSYFWDFGDGDTLTIDSLTSWHLYDQDLVGDVQLIAKDGVGCTDTVTKNLQVDIRTLKAGFTVNARYKNCPPFVARFTDTSDQSWAGIEEWHWYFSDGSSSSVADPVKIFNAPGKYWVALTIIDTLGCRDSVFIPDFIEVGGTSVSYTLSAKNGCEPLQVQVSSTVMGQGDVNWDMNYKGNIIDSSDFTYTYPEAGTYIPSVFVKDQNGCQYSLSISDTIRVLQSPEPKFSSNVACEGGSTQFTNLTPIGQDTISFDWTFEPGQTDTIQDPQYTFAQYGDYVVNLKARVHGACSAIFSDRVIVSKAIADLKWSTSQSCVGDSVLFELNNQGNGAIQSIDWLTGANTITNADSNFNYAYPFSNWFKPQAILTNEYGCKDTTTQPDSILIGSDQPPPSPFLQRVTVRDNKHIGIHYDPIQIPDFDQYLIYRQDDDGTIKQIGNLANISDTFFIDQVLTLDEPHRYRVRALNVCGYYSDTLYSADHRSIELTAYTSDDASYLEWNAYEGWTPDYYEVHRLNDSGKYVKIKEVAGSQTSAYDSAIVCNQGYYYRIMAKGGSPEFFSWSDSSGAVPNYLPYVPPNKLLSASIVDSDEVEVKWTETQGSKVPIVRYYLERSKDGQQYNAVNVRLDEDDFEHRDVVDSASLRPFYYRIRSFDSCGYYSDYSNYGKTIHLTVKLDSLDRPVLQWTNYEDWLLGVDRYRVERLDENGYTELDLLDGSITSLTDRWTRLNHRESYCYRVTALTPEDGGKMSYSNIACAQVRSRIFVPNAFRPDGQQDNRIFAPKGMYVDNYNMKIMNRWGAIVFSSEDIDQGWDGTYQGEAAPSGLYYYIIEYTGTDGRVEQLSGSVHLLR